MINNLSDIQNQILSRLKNAKSLRYAELQIKDIPNDLYNYHLQFLVKKGLLDKNEDGYSLSDLGLKYIADPFASNHILSSQFKINVITILSRIRNNKVEILNQIRKSNPSYGKVGVMGGVVLKGESILDAATRKLNQETGLTANFKLLGCERRIMYKFNELFSDLLFPIAYSDEHSGDLIVDSEFGHNMWVPIEQAIVNESDEFDSIKSINIVLRAIVDGKLNNLAFFFDEVIKRKNT